MKDYIAVITLNFSSGRVYTDTVPFATKEQAEKELAEFENMPNDDKDFCKDGEIIVARSVRRMY